METQKIINLLNDSSNEELKFATKKWYVIDSQTAKGKYKQGDTIKFETYYTLIDNAEDLDVVMPMYNLIEYSKTCLKTTQKVCGIITEMKQVILFLLLLSLLNTRQVLQGILTMFL